MDTLTASRRAANRALWLTLAGGIVGWVCYAVALYSDIAVEAGHTSDELWGDESVVPVRPSTYLFFAAIAVFVLGGLAGRRGAVAARSLGPTRLAQPVVRFSSTVVIIGLVLAANAAMLVFLDNFLSGVGADNVIARVFNSYLPIVLYTVLVVWAILAGFVFSSRAGAASRAEESAAPAGSRPLAAPEADQRTTALAYVLPIVAVMVALIFGLIIYDATQTSLTAWIWVIVQAIIALGICVGTVLAARALAAQRAAGLTPVGAGVGAKNLALVLSIVFAAAVTAMSLGYGASATEQLRGQESMSIDAWNESGNDATGRFTPDQVTISASGYDFARGSEARLMLDDAAEPVKTAKTDADGAFWFDVTVPPDLAVGEHRYAVTAETLDEGTKTLELVFTVDDDGLITLPDETYHGLDDQPMRLITPTASWWFGDLTPALVLLLLVVATLHVTLHARNRDAVAAATDAEGGAAEDGAAPTI